MFMKNHTIEDLRRHAKIQKTIGLFTPSNGQIPPLTWVWVNSNYPKEVTLMGIVLDMHAGLKDTYIVLTTMGQCSFHRARIIMASLDDVRHEAGLSPLQDAGACLDETMLVGPSDANTDRCKSAVAALWDEGIRELDVRVMGVPLYRVSLGEFINIVSSGM